jgi:hypothetical protein
MNFGQEHDKAKESPYRNMFATRRRTMVFLPNQFQAMCDVFDEARLKRLRIR